MNNRVDIEDNLRERLEVIEQLPLGLDEKIFTALVCLGHVRGWEVLGQRGVEPRNLQEIQSQLTSAGFETVILEFPEHPGLNEVCYSNSTSDALRLSELRKRLVHDRSVHGELGEMYGFPKTAIDAYLDPEKEKIGYRDFPPEVQSEDCMALAQFAFSREHWPSEVAVLRQWAAALKAHVPRLWQAYADWVKSYAINRGDR